MKREEEEAAAHAKELADEVIADTVAGFDKVDALREKAMEIMKKKKKNNNNINKINSLSFTSSTKTKRDSPRYSSSCSRQLVSGPLTSKPATLYPYS